METSDSEETLSPYMDGSSNNQGAGAGIILNSPEGLIVEQAIKFDFSTSNN